MILLSTSEHLSSDKDCAVGAIVHSPSTTHPLANNDQTDQVGDLWFLLQSNLARVIIRSIFPSSGVAVVYVVVLPDCSGLGEPDSLQSTKPTDRKAVGCGSIEQHFVLPASVEVVSGCMRRIEKCIRKKRNVVLLIGYSKS